ncbi:putative Sulfotransferase [Candidatus Sulfotelmatobacter sp. SbA7]|nr:putative Sulfotransferase [Candidatus Sulfotelmatobacter sp. SbA7]
MIGELKYVLRNALGKDIAGRYFTTFPDDTFLVSYPRSGNTWTRFLIGNLIQPSGSITFLNIERVIPDTNALSKSDLKRIPRPRILKSHQHFDPRYKKVIYIVRDPRDVALSHYNWQRKRREIDDQYPLERYISRFIAGDLAGWGSWGEHVLSWLATRHNSPDFLLLRYEAMLAEPLHELGKVAPFLGIAATPETLAAAVERSSADNMRKMEETQGSQWVTTKGRREDIPFVGKAKHGGWQSLLPESSVEEIESAWGPLMKTLGYELTRRSGPALEPPFIPLGDWGARHDQSNL